MDSLFASPRWRPRIALGGVLALCLLTGATRAQPLEHWWLTRAEIPDSILLRTIAIANIEQRGPSDSLKPQFVEADSGFLPAGLLNLGSCVPFSKFGDNPTERALSPGGLLRFPVVQLSDGYIRIVTDPLTSSEAWVKRPAPGGSWNAGLVLLDSLTGVAWLDPFTLTATDSLVVYDGPGGKRSRVLRKDSLPGGLRATRQSGDWIFVEAVREDPENYVSTPIGWIRTRDPKGRLLIWLYSEDNC
jgi:hypothetical protein